MSSNTFDSPTPEVSASTAHEFITVRGAAENNLRGVDIDIPKRRLTVFTGVSGSGKSSLVFGTVAAESRRLINETYDAFIQGFMPSMSRPEVELLSGLTAAIIIDQERMAPNPRSTVGTVTDVNSMLRILFSRFAQPQIGSPQAYSFNVASASGAGTLTKADGTQESAGFSVTGGMCLRCEGRGQVNDIDLTQLVDESKSLNEGAITVPGYKVGGWSVRFYSESGFFDPDKPVKDYTDQERQDLFYREPGKVKIGGINMTFQGLVPSVQKSFLAKDRDAMQPHIRSFVDRAVAFAECPDCGGTRLSQQTLSSTIAGKNIAELCAMQIDDLVEWLEELDTADASLTGAEPLLAAVTETLRNFVNIGLGYLSLERSSGTLSGGEAQRVKMIRHLGSSLTDVTYVFDEPTIGLHPHDVTRMNELLLKLRDKGNTVLVVEHNPEVMAVADHIVDMGPAAGSRGGEVVYTGDFAGLRSSATRTGEHLEAQQPLKQTPRTPTGTLEIRGATTHNLRNVDVDVPTGVLVVVTGVAGSGKSSLIHGSVAGHKGVVAVDQAPIRGSRRSNPATYTGLLEPIRKAFAKANGVKPALFSANSEGACPNCAGAGVIYQDLGIVSGISTLCEECQGKRFQSAVLEYRLGGLNIAEVLAMPVEEALKFFSGDGTGGGAKLTAAQKILTRLSDVGLGYLTLGQPLSTLSGGERQRIKLAIEIASDAEVMVLDEPSAGLHMADTDRLIGMLEKMVDSGRTVIVIEHNLDVVSRADWVIDIGPGAGHDGGQVVFSGTPSDLLSVQDSLTGIHLRRRHAG